MADGNSGWQALQESSLGRRKGTAGLIADLLRAQITDGHLEPGSRLPVEKLSQSLAVSANIIREALQLLERERLVVQRLNRGIFVAELGPDDVRDVYLTRRLLELGILREARQAPPEAIAAMADAVELGEAAVADSDWLLASAATTKFHGALVSITGGPRVRDYMLQLMAELRLAMAAVKGDADVHRSYIAQHRPIFNAISAGDFTLAEELLANYLEHGEQTLMDAFAKER